jgi:hypothetical protein
MNLTKAQASKGIDELQKKAGRSVSGADERATEIARAV